MEEDTMFSGESKNIEYKVSLPDKSEKYMKTIVAFANTQGGKLIVGVDDKTHQIVGVENDVLFQLMDGIANAVSDSPENIVSSTILSLLIYTRTTGANNSISRVNLSGSLTLLYVLSFFSSK